MTDDDSSGALAATPAQTFLGPATTLREVARVATLQPLDYGDRRYVDLTPGHGSRDMQRLRLRLERIAEGNEALPRFVKMVFTGHRGCGKTTELLRVEHDFSKVFYPMHIELDENLLENFDYTLLLLWLSEFVVRDFDAKGRPLDPRIVDEVARWFETKTEVRIDDEVLNAQLKAGGEAKAGAGVPGFGLKIFARMKSEVTGSLTRRQEISRTLQHFARELVDKVNLLLEHASRKLKEQGLPHRLLIVHDNLDRLNGETARTLFEDYGDLLRALSAHIIFTAPISLKLAPFSVSSVFPDFYALPMVKIIDRETGEPKEEGLATLKGLLEKRVACDRVFADDQACIDVCRFSGGSVRDLVRLLGYATEHAEVDGKSAIDCAAVARAVDDMRNEYRRILIPERLYYRRLARIHLHRDDGYRGDDAGTPEAATGEREFFAELLLNGAVLEYNGDEPWYDVHPAVQRIRAFRHAVEQQRSAGS